MSRPPAAAVGPGPYRINVAADLCGIAAPTLRAWERRYGVPTPRRTSSAYRLYSAEDVDLIRRMAALVAGGMAPAEAARSVVAERGRAVDVVSPEDTSDPYAMARERILSALERWDGDAIDVELMRIGYALDVQSLFGRVLSPLLVEVGTRWERGALSIAQEHLISEKIELLLRAQLRALDRSDGLPALVACVDEEEHVLALLGAALQLASSGWRVTVLGAATPARALGEAVRSMAPRLVGLSVTRPPTHPKALFRQYAKAIGNTPWVVGGAAAPRIQDAVIAAGGRIAAAPGPEWTRQVRELLRDHDDPTRHR